MLQFARRIARFESKSISDRLTRGLMWRLRHLYDLGAYRYTIMRRKRLRQTVFVGVTGSAGKTTTKDLIASILKRQFSKVNKNTGSLNWPEDMVRVVLSTQSADAYCVAEMSAHGPGAMDLPLALVRPSVGVVTNIGSDHFSAFKGRDAIAKEKGKLIRSLPSDGIAILNADDPLVLAMGAHFRGRIVTFGLADDAMLRGEVMQSSWPDRFSLAVTWNGESVCVRTQLCGTHWASAVLAALATGVALDVPLMVAAQAVASVEPFEARMAPVVVDGIDFIRDDWKAPLSTIEPAFEFMRQARAKRKVILMGTISDYPGASTTRYVKVGQSALAVADCVVFVGPWASASLRAKRDSKDQLRAFTSLRDASAFLSGYLKQGDLVLLKGSNKADHMQRLILARTTSVKCWRTDCGRQNFCDTCELLHVPSGPQVTEDTCAIPTASLKSKHMGSDPDRGDRPKVVIIGLGNPEAGRVNTPHNVGYHTLDLLAQRIARDWVAEGDLAMVARGELNSMPVCLIKPLVPMNDIGPVLFKLARDLFFAVEQCILVHDDLDLPLGSVRARMRGGDGGHRGVRSILQAFQDDQFRRVKIGVGQPREGQSVIDYVLTPFTPGQLDIIKLANLAAADRVVEFFRQKTVR